MKESFSDTEEFVEQHKGLVIALVTRYLSRGGAQREDLVQVGTLALLRAQKSFDPARGFAFSTYAVPVIDGALRDYLRQNTPLCVPRSLHRAASRLSKARSALGEESSLAELAAFAGLSAEEAVLASDVFSAPVPLSELTEEGGGGVRVEEEGYEAVLSRLAVRQALSRLVREDRALISLRYLRGLTQVQTARVLKMTQVQVSRAERRILKMLRREFS